jgi:hypothetical protein
MVEFTLHYMVSNSWGGENSIAAFLQKLRTTAVFEYQSRLMLGILPGGVQFKLIFDTSLPIYFSPSPAQILSMLTFSKSEFNSDTFEVSEIS